MQIIGSILIIEHVALLRATQQLYHAEAQRLFDAAVAAICGKWLLLHNKLVHGTAGRRQWLAGRLNRLSFEVIRCLVIFFYDCDLQLRGNLRGEEFDFVFSASVVNWL